MDVGVYPMERRAPDGTVSIIGSDLDKYGSQIRTAPPTLQRSYRTAFKLQKVKLGRYQFLADKAHLESSLRSLRDTSYLDGLELGLKIVEKDYSDKGIVQSGRAPGYHIPDNPFGINELGFPESLVTAFIAWFGSLGDAEINMRHHATLNTNLGCPTWISGKSPLSQINMLINQAAGMSMLRSYDKYQNAIYPRNPEGLWPCFTTWTRSRQSAHKFLNYYKAVPNGVVKYAEVRGEVAGSRLVYGGEGARNIAGRDLAMKAKAKMYSDTATKPATEAETFKYFASFHARGFNMYSEDLSTYDLTVSARMILDGTYRVYSTLWPNHPFLPLYKDHVYMGIMGPPLSSTHEAFLFAKKGMITSGFVFTDVDGTLLNLMRIVHGVSVATGWNYSETFSRMHKDWGVKVKGDDTVLALPAWVNVDLYTAASSELGFKTTMLPGVTFLMTYYDFERKMYYGLVSRGLMMSYFRERAPAGPATEMFGLYHRSLRLVRHPKFDNFWERIINHPAFTELMGGRMTFSTFEREIVSKRFLDRFEKEVAKGEGIIWLKEFVMGITRGSGDAAEVSGLDSKVLQLIKMVQTPALFINEDLMQHRLQQFDGIRMMNDWLDLIDGVLYNERGDAASLDDIMHNSRMISFIKPFLDAGLITHDLKLNRGLTINLT